MVDIAETIDTVNSTSKTIVSAVEQQSATIGETTRTVTGASQVATEIARNVAEAAEGIAEITRNIQGVNQETSAVADRLKSSREQARSLVGMGDDLATVVRTFQIQSAFLEWRAEMSVGIGEVDRQHQQLVQYINELNDAMSSGSAHETVATILGKLVDYAGTHFGDEEALMSRYGYPDFDAHRRIHSTFVGKVTHLQKQFGESRALLSRDVMVFLKDWLVNHIMGTDQKYGPYLRRKGAS
jgi:methyl-accepting chemotaxis protein/hemerythrin